MSKRNTARFHFLPDLNDFLAPARRSGIFPYSFALGQSIKHLIESAGVPHTEVGSLLVNGEPVDLDYQVQDGDHVEVAPADAENGVKPVQLRFVLDNHLGRLAVYLRMLGLDVLYRNDYDDEELARTAAVDERILLTRDRHLLMRRSVRFGYCLRSLNPAQQLREISLRYALGDHLKPFQRCLLCNTPLEPVSKADIMDQLEPLTKLYFDEFHRCPACGQIYWKGSHYEHMQAFIESIHPNWEGP